MPNCINCCDLGCPEKGKDREACSKHIQPLAMPKNPTVSCVDCANETCPSQGITRPVCNKFVGFRLPLPSAFKEVKPSDVRAFVRARGEPSHSGSVLRFTPVGTEQEVCADIARRQALGIQKYGTTVADNPLENVEWLQHAYEECLDQAVYLKRLIQQMKKGSTNGPKAN